MYASKKLVIISQGKDLECGCESHTCPVRVHNTLHLILNVLILVAQSKDTEMNTVKIYADIHLDPIS